MGDPEPAIAPTDPPAATAASDPADGLLAGVDEAGLGPILGPLVVAGAAMAGPKDRDPWDLLDRRVTKDRFKKGHLRVADSKKVHAGKHALARLEDTVLSFWGAHRGALPVDLAELLQGCGVDVAPLGRCPWYGDLDLPLPLTIPRDEVELSAHTLATCMDEAGIALLHLAVRPVDVEEFNASIEATDNKSDTHFAAFADVIGQLLAALPGSARLVADRCGGRVRYATALRQRLPGTRVKTQLERAALSTYEIEAPGIGDQPTKTVQISFAAGGEDLAFPTALASCFAKYVREVMMTMVNGWFAERIPGLKRTAGYYVDGNRFLQDVGSLLDDPEFPVHRLIRSR